MAVSEKLELDMYEWSPGSERSTRFGLRSEQMRDPRVIKNAGWYNPLGQKLGWGDLSALNLVRLAGELEDGEMFVVLNEENSYWRNVKDVGRFGGIAVRTAMEVDILDESLGQSSGFGTKDEVAEKLPGTDFVASHAEFAVVQGAFLLRSEKCWESGLEHGIRTIPREVDYLVERIGHVQLDRSAEEAAAFEATVLPNRNIVDEVANIGRNSLSASDFYLTVLQYATAS